MRRYPSAMVEFGLRNDVYRRPLATALERVNIAEGWKCADVGAGAGDVMAAVQMAMLAGLPYTAVRDAVIAHPTMPEGLIPLFGNVPPIKAALKRGFQTREAEMALA